MLRGGPTNPSSNRHEQTPRHRHRARCCGFCSYIPLYIPLTLPPVGRGAGPQIGPHLGSYELAAVCRSTTTNADSWSVGLPRIAVVYHFGSGWGRARVGYTPPAGLTGGSTAAEYLCGRYRVCCVLCSPPPSRFSLGSLSVLSRSSWRLTLPTRRAPAITTHIPPPSRPGLRRPMCRSRCRSSCGGST